MEASVPVRPEARPTPMGLIAFCATVVMLFTAFTAAILIRRTGLDWAPIALPWLLIPNTALLVASSVVLEIARRHGARSGWLWTAIALGLAFLAGQALAWRQMVDAGVFLGTTPHGSFIYLLTGVHGVHLIGGAFALVAVGLDRLSVKPAALYWHFMGLVWLYVYLVLASF